MNAFEEETGIRFWWKKLLYGLEEGRDLLGIEVSTDDRLGSASELVFLRLALDFIKAGNLTAAVIASAGHREVFAQALDGTRDALFVTETEMKEAFPLADVYFLMADGYLPQVLHDLYLELSENTDAVLVRLYEGIGLDPYRVIGGWEEYLSEEDVKEPNELIFDIFKKQDDLEKEAYFFTYQDITAVNEALETGEFPMELMEEITAHMDENSDWGPVFEGISEILDIYNTLPAAAVRDFPQLDPLILFYSLLMAYTENVFDIDEEDGRLLFKRARGFSKEDGRELFSRYLKAVRELFEKRARDAEDGEALPEVLTDYITQEPERLIRRDVVKLAKALVSDRETADALLSAEYLSDFKGTAGAFFITQAADNDEIYYRLMEDIRTYDRFMEFLYENRREIFEDRSGEI